MNRSAAEARALARRIRHVFHDVCLFLAAFSALLYLAAALGWFVEYGETADVFGCAQAWAVNVEQLHVEHAEEEVASDVN